MYIVLEGRKEGRRERGKEEGEGERKRESVYAVHKNFKSALY